MPSRRLQIDTTLFVADKLSSQYRCKQLRHHASRDFCMKIMKTIFAIHVNLWQVRSDASNTASSVSHMFC